VTRISSADTWAFKRAFPTLWFGFLLLFVLVGTYFGAAAKEPMLLVVPVIMAFGGYFVMRRFVWDLVDEVYDFGDSLVVKNRGEEVTIPLSAIMNVSASTNQRPPRITLRLAEPSKFGTEIAFVPTSTFTLNPFAKNRVAEDLIVRVDEARSRRAV